MGDDTPRLRAHHRILRALGIVVAALLVLLVIAGGVGVWTVTRSFPQTSGSIDVPGLTVVPQQEVRLGDLTIHPDLVSEEHRLIIEADSFEWHSSSSALLRDCERYTLAADDLQSDTVKLNGAALELGPGDEFPRLAGMSSPPDMVELPPATITFLTIENAKNPACD